MYKKTKVKSESEVTDYTKHLFVSCLRRESLPYQARKGGCLETNVE